MQGLPLARKILTAVGAAVISWSAVAGPLPTAPSTRDFAANAAPPTAKVELGRQLFFDKILGGKQNASCGTCHTPLAGTSDGLSLGLGVGAHGVSIYRTSTGFDRIQDAAPNRIVRNSKALYNLGWNGLQFLFTDGDIGIDASQPSGYSTPLGADFPMGLENLLAAQNMFPAGQPREQAGTVNDNPVSAAALAGDIETVWDLLAARVAAIPEYANQFIAVYPDVSSASDITFVHIANSLAAFEIGYFTAINSPFDAYLRGNRNALNSAQRRGMNLFYGKAGCDVCHSGPMLTDQKFWAISIPQIGPGRATGVSGNDFGRMRITLDGADRYRYITPTLRNIALTAPYGHDGAYATLEGIIRHHLDPVASLDSYDTTQAILPDPQRWGNNDFVEHNNLTNRADRAAANQLNPVSLTAREISDLVAFMHALTDPASLDQRTVVPLSVPSGLPVWD